MSQQGIAYKLVSMDADYLNDWKYDFKIIPQSFQKQDKANQSEELMGEVQQITTLFPKFFLANKDKYLREILELHGKHIDEYNPPEQIPPPNPANPTETALPANQGSVLGLQ